MIGDPQKPNSRALFALQIHWFSIFNSFMMVIFLVGLVSMILMRTLRKDYARYSKEEEMDDMVSAVGAEMGAIVGRGMSAEQGGGSDLLNTHCPWL